MAVPLYLIHQDTSKALSPQHKTKATVLNETRDYHVEARNKHKQGIVRAHSRRRHFLLSQVNLDIA